LIQLKFQLEDLDPDHTKNKALQKNIGLRKKEKQNILHKLPIRIKSNEKIAG
jgi:hypothetical protein